MAADDFDDFVRASSPALLRSAYLLTGDAHLAEDLVQAALVKASLAWRRLDHEGNAHAYVRKVMFHQHISWWRRRRVTEVSSSINPTERASPDAFAAVDLRLSMRAALLALPPRQRAVVVCRYFDDLSEVETAGVLGMAVGTVKSTASRALSALRSALPEHERTGGST